MAVSGTIRTKLDDVLRVLASLAAPTRRRDYIGGLCEREEMRRTICFLCVVGSPEGSLLYGDLGEAYVVFVPILLCVPAFFGL